MLTYRPPIEPRKNLLKRSADVRAPYRYRSIMTRQAICALLRELPLKNVILPRFVPAGVYHPVLETKKRITYYDVPMDLTVDASFVTSLDLDPADTIFYYIHQFGLYIEQNIKLMHEMQSRGFFVIDDRSLSLPVSHYEEFGDATAYSFYKLVGLPFGGQVRTKTNMNVTYSEPDEYHSTLRKKMTANFRFYANPVLSTVPAFPYRAYNKLFSKYVSYNCILDSCLSERPTEIPSHIQR